ncbi:MAG: 3-oxoacyl-ACP synthase III family protein [Gemmatimonadota bacterium]
MSAELTARIAGSGSYLPPTILDNRELFERATIREAFDVERARASLRGVEREALSAVEVFDLWSRQVTGIRERRVLTPESGLTTEEMCAEAGRRALEMAGMAACDLDAVIVASLTSSDIVPNSACTVAALLDVPRLGGFTLNAACAGFVYAAAAGYSLIRSQVAANILVISGDTLSRVTDYSDPKTAVLFGDGAGALILTPSTAGDGILGHPRLTGDYDRDPLYLIGQGWEAEEEPFPKLHMVGGPQILKKAILSMAEVATRALETAGRGWDEVDFVIPHQANLRITQGLERYLKLAKGRVIHTIETYGNLSASTVAVTLDEVLRGRHGTVPDPALIVLTAVGGGYTTAATVIEWRGGAAGSSRRSGPEAT